VSDYQPFSLPAISAVAIVDLRGFYPPRADLYMSTGDPPSVTVEGDAAQRIAGMWRRLPPGEQARCHTPPFGLRFLADSTIVCQASICWDCNNIYGDVGGVQFSYEFNADDEVSQTLLAELNRFTGVASDAAPPA
jgi:hypothetical protein